MTITPRVDFYVLPDQSAQGRERLACRLAEKAYELGNRVYIYVDSGVQARRLDDLLWTFRAGSFVPHRLHPHPEATPEPVIIGWNASPDDVIDLLINLTAAIPPFFERFARVAELVDQDETVRKGARERYSDYRKQGCDPKTHKLNR